MRLYPPLRREKARGLTVFIFHDVTDVPSSFARQYGLFVEPDRFLKQIEWIRNEFRVAHPDELLGPASHDLEGAALITFDDGWAGIFQNALPMLDTRSLSSLVFLNPGPILAARAMVPAAAAYLSQYHPDFGALADEFSLSVPFHLSIHPRALRAFEERVGSAWLSPAIQYQGALVDAATLKRWQASPLVRFGNHLYDHWNSCALTDGEFSDQFIRASEALREYPAYRPFLAFPNGRPGVAYGARHVALAKQLGVERVFSGLSVINESADAFELHRVSLTRDDVTASRIWFRLGRQLLARD